MSTDRGDNWMHTASGGRFFPADIRMSDFTVNDLANGMAMECRYGGQGCTSRWYSVAEHCYHGAKFIWVQDGKDPIVALAFLFHDAAEGLVKDLPRPLKSILPHYGLVEKDFQRMIFSKYNLLKTAVENAAYLADIDNRMIRMEKPVLMKHPQPWPFFDSLPPLPGVGIACWQPAAAKEAWASMYRAICETLGWKAEEIDE